MRFLAINRLSTELPHPIAYRGSTIIDFRLKFIIGIFSMNFWYKRIRSRALHLSVLIFIFEKKKMFSKRIVLQV